RKRLGGEASRLHFPLDSSLRRQSPRVGSTWWIPSQRATKPGEAIADAFVAKLSIGPRSPLGAPPRWLRSSGVESPQQTEDSPWTRALWTDWVTRSPSCRLTSTPRPPASSISSGSSTPEEAGTPAFAPAPPG